MTKLISVYGMTGENCRKDILTGLEKVVGIEKISITLSNRIVEVTFDEKLVSLDTIKQHIHTLGYDPM